MTTIETAAALPSLNSRHATLASLLSEILDLDARKRDLVADTRAMSFTAEGAGLVHVDVGETVETFHLTDHAVGQMASDLGIPRKYWDRMRAKAPDLLRSNVHHWLAAEPERRLIRGYTRPGAEEPIGRAWLSDRYRRLDNIEIARTLLPEFSTMETAVEFQEAYITDSRLYVRVVFPEFERPVKVGDVVRFGVEIRNSEIGSGTLGINGFVLRLACTNGMVASRELSARHVGRRIDDEGILSDEAIRADDSAFWLAARDTLRATISETRFEEIVATLAGTTETTRIEKPIRASEVLASRLSLTEEERERVLLALVSEGDLSCWGAINAITASAKASDSFDRQVEMEQMGWALATAPVREWETIALAS